MEEQNDRKDYFCRCCFYCGCRRNSYEKEEYLPRMRGKKLISKCGVHIKAAGEYGNNAALTPPMGWSSWNTFRNNINEQLILDTADAMKKAACLMQAINM